MKYILFILLFLVIAVHGEIFYRIEPGKVGERIIYFINKNKIQQCFESWRGENELALKCLKDDHLVDVLITIEETFSV